MQNLELCPSTGADVSPPAHAGQAYRQPSMDPVVDADLVDPDHDFFSTQGHRDLCVALLSQAAHDLAAGQEDPEAQATLAWINGADSPIPFSVCLEVLGIDHLEDSVRKALLEAPSTRPIGYALRALMGSSVWGQKASVTSILADESEVIASYRSTMRG